MKTFWTVGLLPPGHYLGGGGGDGGGDGDGDGDGDGFDYRIFGDGDLV